MIIEVGSYDKLPHYSLCGSPMCWYITINDKGTPQRSEWFTGQDNYTMYNALIEAFHNDRDTFSNRLLELFNRNRLE